MSRLRLVSFAIAINFAVTGAVHAEERPEAKELLGRFRQTMEQLTTYYSAATCKTVDPFANEASRTKYVVTSKEFTLVRHGGRLRFGGVRHMSTAKGDMFTMGEEHLIDDAFFPKELVGFAWNRFDPNRLFVNPLNLDGERKPESVRTMSDAPFPMFGGSITDSGQLWWMMERATTLEVLPGMETVAEHKTYVVKSQGKDGIHTVWLDPEFGCLPRKIVVDKLPGHLSGMIQLGVKRNNSSLEELHRQFDNIKLERKQEQFLITAYDMKTEEIKLTDDRREQLTNRTEFRVQTIELDSTLWPPNAFRLAVEIPEGTLVVNRTRQPCGVWKNGKIELNP